MQIYGYLRIVTKSAQHIFLKRGQRSFEKTLKIPPIWRARASQVLTPAIRCFPGGFQNEDAGASLVLPWCLNPSGFQNGGAGATTLVSTPPWASSFPFDRTPASSGAVQPLHQRKLLATRIWCSWSKKSVSVRFFTRRNLVQQQGLTSNITGSSLSAAISLRTCSQGWCRRCTDLEF